MPPEPIRARIVKCPTLEPTMRVPSRSRAEHFVCGGGAALPRAAGRLGHVTRWGICCKDAKPAGIHSQRCELGAITPYDTLRTAPAYALSSPTRAHSMWHALAREVREQPRDRLGGGRLHQVRVEPGLHRAPLVALLAPARERHQVDRLPPRFPAELPRHFIAVESRHPDVEER